MLKPTRLPGSSPLTRGKPSARETDRPRHRLIPAHAGKTRSTPAQGKGSRAHPRSRGENGGHHTPWRTDKGSSPLTRGKQTGRDGGSRRTGLIPAHAGKTTHSVPTMGAKWAHPRSRGENITNALKQLPGWGSSPLTRGKHQVGGRLRDRLGLIPAHAGKTRRARGPRNGTAAHPRSRGENVVDRKPQMSMTGSSPLTRGKLPHRGSGRKAGRLIPAHAGKTRRWRPATRPTRAHPRSRGENMKKADAEALKQGSSPLTRGKLGIALDVDPTEGLIPAHAGKTAPGPTSHTSRRAHPRSRGENTRAPVTRT